MTTEVSCGGVVFTRDPGYIQYVIVRSKDGCYGFPKGHTEDTETETETALREIAEETGLTTDLVDGFRMEIDYSFLRNGETRMKHVVYFLAEYANQIPAAQESELDGIYLMRFEEAMRVLQFGDLKRILTQAAAFLENSYKQGILH